MASDARDGFTPGPGAAREECDRLARYLIGEEPPGPVRERYGEALERHATVFAPGGRLDAALLAMSRWAWLPVRAADVAARFLSPASALRRRLVLLIALLECVPETAPRWERPDVSSRTAFFAGLAGRGLVTAGALGVGLPLALVAAAVGAGRELP